MPKMQIQFKFNELIPFLPPRRFISSYKSGCYTDKRREMGNTSVKISRREEESLDGLYKIRLHPKREA